MPLLNPHPSESLQDFVQLVRDVVDRLSHLQGSTSDVAGEGEALLLLHPGCRFKLIPPTLPFMAFILFSSDGVDQVRQVAISGRKGYMWCY